MKVLIYLIPLIGISSATFGRLLGGGGLNSLLGGGGAGGGLLGGGSGSGKSLDDIKGGGPVEENYISIIDQLGPGKVIERGTLRKRLPKSNADGSLGDGHQVDGGPVGGGPYHAGNIISDAQHGQIIKVIDEGPETIVNVYGDASGGFGGGHSAEGIHGGYVGGGGGSGDGVTIIRVIHEYASSNGGHGSAGGYGGGSHIGGRNGPITVYKIIENSSYGGDHSNSVALSNAITSGIYSNSVHSSGGGSGGWAPVTGQKGW